MDLIFSPLSLDSMTTALGVHCNADVTSPNSVPPGKEMQHSVEELNLSDQKMGIM